MQPCLLLSLERCIHAESIVLYKLRDIVANLNLYWYVHIAAYMYYTLTLSSTCSLI